MGVPNLSPVKRQAFAARSVVIDWSPGVYTILVHDFSPNLNLLAGETHVEVTVTRKAGSPAEETVR